MQHTVVPIRYSDATEREFQDALQERVAEYLKQQPNGRYATPFMWFKCTFFILAFVTLWALLVFTRHSWPTTVLLVLLFAAVTVSLTYTVSHDAVHGALSRHPRVNRILYCVVFNLLGPSAYLWRKRHEVMHHTCANIPGFDHNVDAEPMLRLAPTQRKRAWHRWQHLCAPLLYMLVTIEWIFRQRLSNVFSITGWQRQEHQALGMALP